MIDMIKTLLTFPRFLWLAWHMRKTWPRGAKNDVGFVHACWVMHKVFYEAMNDLR